MPETVIDQAYLEKVRSAVGVEFVHVTLRDTGRTHAVEEVVGAVDREGKRRGEILSIVADATLGEAQRVFAAQVSGHCAAGFQKAR